MDGRTIRYQMAGQCEIISAGLGCYWHDDRKGKRILGKSGVEQWMGRRQETKRNEKGETVARGGQRRIGKGGKGREGSREAADKFSSENEEKPLWPESEGGTGGAPPLPNAAALLTSIDDTIIAITH